MESKEKVESKRDHGNASEDEATSARMPEHAGSHFKPELEGSISNDELADEFYHDDTRGVIGPKPDSLRVRIGDGRRHSHSQRCIIVTQGSQALNRHDRSYQQHSCSRFNIEAIRVCSHRSKKEMNHVPT